MENGGDALVGKRSDGDGPGRDSLDTSGFEPAKKLEDTEAGSKRLLGMTATGEHRDDKPVGIGSDERAQRSKV